MIFAVAGCAPAVPVHGGGSSPTAGSPHPTATPKPLPAWNGNCTLFFTDAQSQAVTGQATTLQPAGSFVYGFDAVTALAGGHESSTRMQTATASTSCSH